MFVKTLSEIDELALRMVLTRPDQYQYFSKRLISKDPPIEYVIGYVEVEAFYDEDRTAPIYGPTDPLRWWLITQTISLNYYVLHSPNIEDKLYTNLRITPDQLRNLGKGTTLYGTSENTYIGGEAYFVINP